MRKGLTRTLSTLLCSAMVLGSLGISKTEVFADELEVLDSSVEEEMLGVEDEVIPPEGNWLPALDKFRDFFYERKSVYMYAIEAEKFSAKSKDGKDYEIKILECVFADAKGKIVPSPYGEGAKYSIVLRDFDELGMKRLFAPQMRGVGVATLEETKDFAAEMIGERDSEELDKAIKEGDYFYGAFGFYYGLRRIPKAPEGKFKEATDEFTDEVIKDYYSWVEATPSKEGQYETKDKVKYNINIYDVILADVDGNKKGTAYFAVIVDKDGCVCDYFGYSIDKEEDLDKSLAESFAGQTSEEIETLIENKAKEGLTIDGLKKAMKKRFKDVNYESWMGEAVEFVDANGLMSGVSDTEFAPNDPCTREMMVQILYNDSNYPDIKDLKNPFEDVKKGTWYYKAIVWGVNNGATKGIEKNKFGVGDELTREQVAQFLYNYLKSMKGDVSSDKDISEFKDAKKVSGWAQNAMKWAVDKQLIKGKVSKSDGKLKLDPQGIATRAEVAQILYNYISKDDKGCK